MFCCCAKPRKDGDDATIENQSNQNLKGTNRVLLEFSSHEAKLCMKDVPCMEMIEGLLMHTSNGENHRKEVIEFYKSKP
jgi:hypothetical protein